MNTKIINEALLKKAAEEKDFDEAMELILGAYGQEDSEVINVLPNVPKVKSILKNHEDFKDWEEHGFWIITENLFDEIFNELDSLGFIPYHCYYENYNDFLNK